MKKVVIALVLLLLVGVGTYFFFHRDGDKARDVVPADATSVAVVEPAKLAEQCGLSLRDLQKLSSAFKGFDELIDLSKPVYAFSGEDVQGVALNLRNAEKALDVLTSYGFTCEERDGLKWVAYAGDAYVGCLDKEKMLICDSEGRPSDALRSAMAALMTQGRKDVPALESADARDGVLRLSAPLSSVPDDVASQFLPDEARRSIPSDAVVNAALQIGHKDITLAANLSADLSQLPIAPIRGDLAAVGPKDPFLWLCFNMQGEQLLTRLRQDKRMRTALLALNMCIDADMMLKAVNGDVSIVMPKLDLQHPDLLLTATLSDTNFLSGADGWQGVTRRGGNDFSITVEGQNIYFGVRDGKLYIASSESLAGQACRPTEADAFRMEAKGKYLRGAVNVGQVLQAYPGVALLLRTLPQVRDLADALKRVSLTADSPQSIELSVETDKPVKDIMSSLWKLID